MLEFAQTEEEAKARAARFKSLDPFPDICPALLNSADIHSYVAATAMIFPFDTERLKSATYEASLGELVIDWNDENAEQRFLLKPYQSFVLRRNSIAFVTIDAQLRVPDYIALRFNLRIKWVHSGILLGTGPLVDPGFEKNLLIPLHNLTTNNYELHRGEGLIWIEFTKLSPNRRWLPEQYEPPILPREGTYHEFPKHMLGLEAEAYLAKAVPHRSIRSSISDVVTGSERSAQRAEADAKAARAEAVRIRERITIAGAIAVIAVVISLVAVYLQVTSFYRDSNSYLQAARHDLSVLENKAELQKHELEPPERMTNLEKTVDRLNARLDKLEKSGDSKARKAKPFGPKVGAQ